MKFSLSTSPRPVLAICNEASKVYFWHLKRLEDHWDYFDSLPANTPKGVAPLIYISNASNAKEKKEERKRPPFMVPLKHRKRGGAGAMARVRDLSPTESTTSSGRAGTHDDLSEQLNDLTFSKWNGLYNMQDAHEPLMAHKEDVIKHARTCGRQVAWSTGGEWFVVVGSGGVIAIFERWGGKVDNR
jgi:polycomb protein EED